MRFLNTLPQKDEFLAFSYVVVLLTVLSNTLFKFSAIGQIFAIAISILLATLSTPFVRDYKTKKLKYKKQRYDFAWDLFIMYARMSCVLVIALVIVYINSLNLLLNVLIITLCLVINSVYYKCIYMKIRAGMRVLTPAESKKYNAKKANDLKKARQVADELFNQSKNKDAEIRIPIRYVFLFSNIDTKLIKKYNFVSRFRFVKK